MLDFTKSYYRFIFHGPDGVRTIVHIPYGECSKSELIDQFTFFLRGCGYNINTLYEEEDTDGKTTIND